MKKTPILIFTMLLFLPIVFSLNTAMPPYMLNLYNASYYVTTQNNTYYYNITNGTAAGSCPDGFAVQNTTSNGVQCTSLSAGSGTVTNVIAGYGLNYTSITTSGTLNVNDSVMQNRVSSTCAAGSSIRVIYQNGTVECENDSTGSGTVTSVATGFGLLGGTIVNSGTLYVNMADIGGNIGNWSADKSSYTLLTYTNALNNLSYANVQTRIDANGNWSNDRSNYPTLTYVNAINNVSLSTIQARIDANGNWTFDKPYYAFYPNITQIQTNLASLITNVSQQNGYANITNLNANKSGLGTVTCGVGYGLQNISLTVNSPTGQCTPLSVGGGGTVTSVNTGFGLYGGEITVSGTLYVNMTDISGNIGNWSADKSSYTLLTYTNALNNLSYANVQTRIDANGNWSADKSSYPTLSYVNAINNVSLSTIQARIDANGNWTLDKPYYAFYPNITQLQTSLNSLVVNVSQQNGYTNITQLQTSIGTLVTNVSQQNAYSNVTYLQSANSGQYTNITQLQTSIGTLVTNVSQQNGYTNITQLQTNIGTLTTNTTNDRNNLNTSKANLAGATFTGNVQVPVLNVTSNITILGVTGTMVCVVGDNYGCAIKANSTCRQYLSPDGLTAFKVANSGTVC